MQQQRVDLRVAYPPAKDKVAKKAAELDRIDAGEAPDVPWWVYPGAFLNILVFIAAMGCFGLVTETGQPAWVVLGTAFLGLNTLFARASDKYVDDYPFID